MSVQHKDWYTSTDVGVRIENSNGPVATADEVAVEITGTQAHKQFKSLTDALEEKVDVGAAVTSVVYDQTNKKIVAYKESTPTDVVTVAKIKDDLNLAKSDVGLGNVDNTSDANKPISTAVQAALNTKVAQTEFDGHVNDTDNPHQVTAAQVGLGNVDNTPDAEKDVNSAVKDGDGNIITETYETIAQAGASHTTLQGNIDAVSAIVQNLTGLEGTNFGGFSLDTVEATAISNIATIYTSAGYTSGDLYWFLAGTDMSALKAYRYDGSGSPVAISSTVYDFTDFSGIQTKLANYKGTVSDLDALHNSTDIGVYFYSSGDKNGLVSVGYSTTDGIVTQHWLSDGVPDASDVTIFTTGPALLMRTYSNSAWSAWQNPIAKNTADIAALGLELDKIDKLIYPLAKYDEVAIFPNTSSKWETGANLRGVFIPCNGAEVYKIASTNNNCVFAFLKSYEHTPNTSLDFASGASRQVVYSGNEKTGNVPSDAEYLYVSTKNGSSWQPTSVILDGYDYVMGANVSIGKLNKEIENISSSVTSLSGIIDTNATNIGAVSSLANANKNSISNVFCEVGHIRYSNSFSNDTATEDNRYIVNIEGNFGKKILLTSNSLIGASAVIRFYHGDEYESLTIPQNSASRYYDIEFENPITKIFGFFYSNVTLNGSFALDVYSNTSYEAYKTSRDAEERSAWSGLKLYNMSFNSLVLSPSNDSTRIGVLPVSSGDIISFCAGSLGSFIYAILSSVPTITSLSNVDITSNLVVGGNRKVVSRDTEIVIPSDGVAIIFSYGDRSAPTHLYRNGIDVLTSINDNLIRLQADTSIHPSDLPPSMKRQNELIRKNDYGTFDLIPSDEIVVNPDNLLSGLNVITPTGISNAINPTTKQGIYYRGIWWDFEGDEDESYDWTIIGQLLQSCATNRSRLYLGISPYNGPSYDLHTISNTSAAYIANKSVCDDFISENELSWANGVLAKDGVEMRIGYPEKYLWMQIADGCEPPIFTEGGYSSFALDYNSPSVVDGLKNLYSALYDYLDSQTVNGVNGVEYVECLRLSVFGQYGEGWFHYDIAPSYDTAKEITEYILEVFDDVSVALPRIMANNYTDIEKLREYFSLSNSSGKASVFYDTMWNQRNNIDADIVNGIFDLIWKNRRICGETHPQHIIKDCILSYIFLAPTSLVATRIDSIRKRDLSPVLSASIKIGVALTGAQLYVRYMYISNGKFYIDLQNIGLTKVWSKHWQCALYFYNGDTYISKSVLSLKPQDIEPNSVNYHTAGLIKEWNDNQTARQYIEESVVIPSGTTKTYFAIEDPLGVYENYWLRNGGRTDNGMYEVDMT